ncbi:putative LysR-family transcriptional regulator [plant metagenome]|uniref:Putative LysR-family transcriptional regulator n=1 Tax=plant metagenome TaxID=1297885 RepID=A0A484SWP8_9ZZZZ
MAELKHFEDLIALARTGSFVRAAELRHVTHPAFGRRIRALEAWAGVPLVERDRVPVRLTTQGEALLKTAGQMVEQLGQLRHRMHQSGPGADAVLRIATGRTLASTLVADWIARLRARPRPVLGEASRVEIVTGRMQDMVTLLEQGKADLLCGYAHPSLAVPLSPARYRFMTLGTDKLVPVCQMDRRGKPRHPLAEDGACAPLISYSGGLSMARILEDRLDTRLYALSPFLRCDSLDAAHGAALRGLGVAWLPWSMVAGDCRRGALAALGGRSDEILFEVRLYRSQAALSALAETAWDATQRGR